MPRDFTKLLTFCQRVAKSLEPFRRCLLWVTESEIWDGGANWHLYYRLRQSYGDLRRLHEAPGHLFQIYETADMVSFVEVAALCGFDAHLIPDSGYSRAFVSHDEFVEFAASADNPELVKEFAEGLDGSTITGSPRSVP